MAKKRIVRRKMRKQITGIMNPWGKDLEAGMRVFDPYAGEVIDLVESTGRNKRDAGILTPKIVITDAKAVKIGRIWYWERVVKG